MNAGKLDFLQAITLLKEKDVTVGMEKLKKMLEEADEAEKQHEQQMMMAQEQAKQEGQQKMMQSNAMSQQASLQNQKELQSMKGAQDIQGKLIDQRGELLEAVVKNEK